MKTGFCRFLGAVLAAAMLAGLCSAPAAAAGWSQRVEAETGDMTGTVRTENIRGGSGRTVSFIDNGPANALEIRVTPQGGADYVMKLRYRSGVVRNLMYQVNGGPARRISGFSSGSWSAFANLSIPVTLEPGRRIPCAFLRRTERTARAWIILIFPPPRCPRGKSRDTAWSLRTNLTARRWTPRAGCHGIFRPGPRTRGWRSPPTPWRMG